MPDQIYGVTWNGKEQISHTYDGLGRLTNKAIGGNVPFPLNTTYSYFDVDDTKTTTLLSSMSNDYLTYNYTYDELGNITNININQDDYSSYEYDELNQLVRENDVQLNKTRTYEYVNGNIKYIHEYAYTTGELPSTPNITTEYHYEDSTWSDVLTGVSQYRYTASNTSTYGLRNNSSSSFEEYVRSILGDDLGDYEIVDLGSRALLNLEPENSDASTYSLPGNTSLRFNYSVESDEIGNITNIDGIEIEWDGRRAVAVQQGDNTITYEYNIDGQRTKKTVNGVTTEYFYNGDILAGQKTGNDTIIFMYDNNGDIFGFEYNGTPYYYVKNAQNDVVMVLNCNDRTAVVYQYDAWGNITDVYDSTTQRVSNINPITYRSYYYDIEMGVYYLNSRYYAPVICRFISGDGYVDTQTGMLSHNMFAYCNNNPVNCVDPTGTLTLGGLLFCVAATIVVSVFSACMLNKRIKATNVVEDAAYNIADKKIKGIGIINKLKSFGDTVNSLPHQKETHAKNVVNANYAKGKNQSFHVESFNKSLYSNDYEYSRYCVLRAEVLEQHTESISGFSISGKQWDDLSSSQQEKIVNEMGTWDAEVAVDIAKYGYAQAFFDLFV